MILNDCLECRLSTDSRTHPCTQLDILNALAVFITRIKGSHYLVLVGDFNAQLVRDQKPMLSQFLDRSAGQWSRLPRQVYW